MRTRFFLLIIILLSVLFLIIAHRSVRTPAAPSNMNNMVSFSNIELDELIKYQNTHLKDAATVSAILNILPGNLSLEKISLTDHSITVNYGIPKNSIATDDELFKYWTTEKIRTVFLHNATAIFILVQNADTVTFTLDMHVQHTFTISRQDLENWYENDLKKYSSDTSAWEEEIINKQIDSPDQIKLFYTSHKITQSY